MARSLAETADPRDAWRGRCGRSARASGGGWAPSGSRPPIGPRRSAAWRPGTPSAWTPEDFEAASREISLAAGEGLPGRVWQSGEPAWIPTCSPTTTSRARRGAARGPARGVLLPDPQRARVLGVIEFFTGEPREPDAELLATMAALGDQIGQAVERRRDAEALRAKEARHRAMLDAALDCVVTMDHEGRVVDFNPAAERTFGYAAADAVGRDMAELIVPPELRERHRRGLRALPRDGEPRCSTAASRSRACAPTARRSRSS